MSDLNDLIGALGSGDEDAAQTHFQSVMNSKIQTALDAKKIEVAQDMYGTGFADDDGIEVEEYELEGTEDEVQTSETETD